MADDRPTRPVLFHEVDGAGPPVVLLHAGIADARMWDDQLPALVRRYTVVRPELRGFGRTQAPPGSFAHRNDVRDLLDALAIRSTAVVGASMGGEVAIDLAIAHPQRVGALVLAGSALGGWHFTDEATLEAWAALGRAVEAGDYRTAARLELEMWVAGPGRPLVEVDQHVIRRVYEMLLPMYHRPEVEEDQPLDPPAIGRLGEITAPTLIIVGQHDRPDMHKIAELLAAGIRRARLAVLPRCAHMPSMERPGPFNELVMDFLASVSTRQARAMGKGADYI